MGRRTATAYASAYVRLYASEAGFLSRVSMRSVHGARGRSPRGAAYEHI